MHKTNPQLLLAEDFIRYTDKHLFLTGKAGTGKTTFLRNIQKTVHKRMIVVAPTGVAAINAGGTTIHSFFQIGFGPQIPLTETRYAKQAIKQRNLFRFSKEKSNIIKSLDLLIIDEISMVRPDLLDAIDKVLRRFREAHKPFGGVQLLMIGDLQQLPPIVKDDEKELLGEYYSTPFFFSSIALSKSEYVTIELQHIYRQNDSTFVALLNQLRDGSPTNEAIKCLNERYLPQFKPTLEDNYIQLTTHNSQANKINNEQLLLLPGKTTNYTARITGEFPEYSYPTALKLSLKKGAQVMFVKNDSSPQKRYYNGKIGRIAQLSSQSILVQCPNEEDLIEVKPEEWQNTKYTLDETTKEIKEEVVGKFVQIPLKTAWAITIHKSQGLTFDKVIINAGLAFSHGQVYVALSRCKTLEGIVLSTPLSHEAIISNHSVIEFTKNFQEHQPNKQLLQDEKLNYQKKLVLELINFSPLLHLCYRCSELLHRYSGSFHGNLHELFEKLIPTFRDEIDLVANNFEQKLTQHLTHSQNIEQDKHIQERIPKGARYFAQKLEELLVPTLENYSFETDNKEAKKLINTKIEQIQLLTHIHLSCLRASYKQFSVDAYLKAKAIANIDSQLSTKKKKKQKVNKNAGSSTQDSLYEQLRIWRNKKASDMNIPVYMIAQQKTLSELSSKLPASYQELKAISGMGDKRIAAYGQEIIEIIETYCKQHKINFNNLFTKPPKE